jgi:short-subunit dehydrogenase
MGGHVAGAGAARGASVGLQARDPVDLEALRAELAPVTAVAVAPCDVADPEALRGALAALESELGPADVLVANAGIGLYGPFLDTDPADLERLVRVNVLGTMHAIRAVGPGMAARRRGHIVIIGSIAGRLGAPFEAVYSATKFAQTGLSECLAVELSAHDVAVSTVHPGPVDTGFFEARGARYDRARPKQVPTSAVVDAVVRALDRGTPQRTVPRSLGAAVVVAHLVPALSRWGTRRAFRNELAKDKAKRI